MPDAGGLFVNVAVIPGDGVGPEVIAEARRVVDATGVGLAWSELDWGSRRFHVQGAMMPTDGIDILREHDAVLLGAVGDPSVPDHESLWGLILRIRQQLDLGVNLRPARLLEGVPCPLVGRGPDDVDMVFIRENTEGEYSGAGGRVHRDLDHEVAVETSVFTRRGCETAIRAAFQIASRREGVLISATKSNASRFGFTFWDEIVEEVGASFADVRVERVLVDALCARLVSNPASVDVVVASNLFGDILTDLAAALQGGMGVAASASLGPDLTTPALFEPVHGSAPDIAGKGVANPVGAIWSAALMLEYLGAAEQSRRVMDALELVCRSGPRTRDLGGTASTSDIGEAVVKALAVAGDGVESQSRWPVLIDRGYEAVCGPSTR